MPKVIEDLDSNGDEFDCPVCGEKYVPVGEKCRRCETEYKIIGTFTRVEYDRK